jgi:hypothetical protein
VGIFPIDYSKQQHTASYEFMHERSTGLYNQLKRALFKKIVGQKVLILEIEADIYCLESNLWDPNEKMLTFGNMLLL